MNTNELLNTIREALELLVTRIDNDTDSSVGSKALFALDQLEAQQQGGLSVDEVMGIYHEWDKQAADGIIPMIPDLRARLTAKAQGK